MGRKNITSERRQQIIWALFELLAENGSEKVSVKHIATQAGVQHGVIHYYFKNKNEIFTSLIESMQSKYDLLWTHRKTALKAEGKPASGISGLQFMVKELICDPRLNRVYSNLLQMSFENEDIKQALAGMCRHYREELAKVLEEAGVETGREEMALILQALMNGLGGQWLLEPESIDFDKTLQMIDVMFTHLGNAHLR